MPLQNFVANNLPTIKAVWLNAIDNFYVTLFQSATTAAQARTAILAAQSGANTDITSLNGPALGTPASGVATNLTGTAAGLSIGGNAATATAATTATTATSATTATTATNQSGGTVAATTASFSGLITTTGGQIKFPAVQVPSADPNTLDDYAEGTWTPSVGGTATYTLASGNYVKIGRTVYFTGALVINVIGTGSTSIISGLPFTVAIQSVVNTGAYSGLALSIVSMCGIATLASTSIVLYSQTAASAAQATNAVLGNASQVYLSGSYLV